MLLRNFAKFSDSVKNTFVGNNTTIELINRNLFRKCFVGIRIIPLRSGFGDGLKLISIGLGHGLVIAHTSNL